MKFLSLMILAVVLTTAQAQTQQASPVTSKSGETITDVTTAQVVGKVLDMVSDTAWRVTSTLGNVAPKVWEITVRQQYVNALGMLIGPFLSLLLIGVCTLVMKRYWKKYPDEDPYFDQNDDLTDKGDREVVTSLIPGILVTVFIGVLIYRAVDAVPMIINPEYYALKDLLQMLLK